MRLTIFLILIGISNVYATSTYSQNTKFTFHLRDISLEQLFEEIQNQSEFNIFYKNSQVDKNRMVSVSVDKSSVEDILLQALEGTNLDFKVIDRQIVVFPEKTLPEKIEIKDVINEQPQKKEISGKITDSNGLPLPGVTVIIKETTIGIVTDADGQFTLEIPIDAQILQVSFVGMKTQELIIGNDTVFNITMEEETVGLEEVVAVGYGTARKSDVTGSIAMITEETLKEIPASSISQALQGRTAGVTISQESTRPGAAQQIRIRGTRSLTASNDPLIIVDGIPFYGNLSDINQDDIASIDILKDASSTAIYGSRGANGVILITTFRGESGKLQVSYNGYYGAKTVARRYKLLDGEGLYELREKNNYQRYTQDELDNIELGFATDWAEGSVDWQDLMYEMGMVTSHDLTLTGGNDNSRFSFGTNYYDETTVVPGQGFNRYSVKGTFDQSLFDDKVKFGMTTQNSYSTTSGAGDSETNLTGGVTKMMYAIITSSPLTNPYNEDGSINLIPQDPAENQYNPLLYAEDKVWAEDEKRFVSFNTLYAEIKLLKGLKYRINAGLNFIQTNYGSFYASISPQVNGGLSRATVRNTRSENYTFDNLLYYDRIFSDKHRLSLTGLFGLEGTVYRQSQFDASDMIADYVEYNNLGLSNTVVADPANQIYSKRTLQSYMFRVNYSYDNRYVFTGTFRRDGSSVLSPGNKWQSFPSLSVAWNINEESFMEDQNLMSNLRLRLGYGLSANQGVEPYGTLGKLSQNLYNFGSDFSYGYYVSALATSDVGWEYTHAYSGGIDFGFLNNRITGSLDMYYQKTEDLLLGITLPYTTGATDPVLQNLGATENKGIELALSGDIVQAKRQGGFNFNMDLNFYINRNELLELYSGITEDRGNGWFVGHPIDAIYDYNKLGIWQLGQEEEAAVYDQLVGDIRVEDVNDDDVIDPDNDRKVIGTFDPDLEGGFTMRFDYKNFDLTTVGFYRIGGTLVNTMFLPGSYVMTSGRRNEIYVDYWTPDNPTNVAPEQRESGGSLYTSTLAYSDASFLKIRTITLGYTIPNNWLEKKKLGISSLRVYFLCQNPFVLFSPYMKEMHGVDPEPTGRGDQSFSDDAVADGGIQPRQLTIGLNTPPTRNFIFGVNLKF